MKVTAIDGIARSVDTPLVHGFKRIATHCVGERQTGNALIRGDNYEVLKRLATKFAGHVRCAYLDPPYNNGETYEHYLDNMGHEEWLRAVTSRLQLIESLLASDGSVWISIDDSEVHYLKVAADTIFGRENFIGTVVWERRTTRENRRALSRNHEYVLAYAKDLKTWAKRRNALPMTNDIAARYRNIDGDPRGPWQSISANVQDGHATPSQFYVLVAPNGTRHTPPNGRCWVYTRERMEEQIRQGNVWFGRDGNATPRLKKFMHERSAGVTPSTLWTAEEVGTTSSAKKHLLELFQDASVFDTPKPEELISRILHISTNSGDLVLDPYLGSGTTAAVAHKMSRRYIGIEKGQHIVSHCVARLRRVIEGEPGGISRNADWAGGGGFDFYAAS